MIHELDDVRQGYDIDCDVVVVGSGPGGAVAAGNYARAGMRTVVLEAGPRITPELMIRDAPTFLARYFWEGGLRLIGGTAPSPSLQGRCLGGSSVVNSAIMLTLPDWVRQIWQTQSGLPDLCGSSLDGAYQRIFADTGTAPTPLSVMGRKNRVVQQALTNVGIRGAPLPRAVIDCEGCSDCLTGCVHGHKQSVDRCYLEGNGANNLEVYTCSMADRIEVSGTRATGISGQVVKNQGRERIAPFSVRAKKVVVAAGTMHTPALLLRSGIDGCGNVGRTFYAHIGGGLVGIMEQEVNPWLGATQGWGGHQRGVPRHEVRGAVGIPQRSHGALGRRWRALHQPAT